MRRIITKFFTSKLAPGVLLATATFLALAMENSMFAGLYDAIKDTPVILQIGFFRIDKPLLLWINDGLMAIFFLLVGLEVKREVLKGHLSQAGQVSLPVIAALGGVVMPALIYVYFNMNSPETMDGWAIPAATDIAFALGVLTLLGTKAPNALKVCLVAIAIIDDLAAIVIIALFYTADTSFVSLGLAGVGLLAAFTLNKMGVTKLGPYAVLGLFIWACVLKSGIHATLAGVALGLIIPLRIKNDEGKSPLKVMEHALHPWVVFAVIPLFAFVNAGLSFRGLKLDTFAEPITLGIIAGLFIGKPLGVLGFTFIGAKLKLCTLPIGVTWLQFAGLSLLTGIGFTMSLFIGNLAFDSVVNTSAVRLGVLTGSVLSSVAGVGLLLLAHRKFRGAVPAAD